MVPALLLVLLVVPVIELYVIVQVSHLIGLPETLVVLIVVSVAGTYLLRREGAAAWMRVREALQRGEMPTREVTDGFMILLGGALLVTPGFVTDAVGLLLLFVPTRTVIKRFARRLFLARLRRSRSVGRGVYTVAVTRTRRSPANSPSRAPGPASEELPRGEVRDDENGSRGRE